MTILQKIDFLCHYHHFNYSRHIFGWGLILSLVQNLNKSILIMAWVSKRKEKQEIIPPSTYRLGERVIYRIYHSQKIYEGIYTITQKVFTILCCYS